MRNIEAWRPTKFVMIDGRLRCDPTGVHVSIGSRLLSDLVAKHYEGALREHARGSLLDLGCGSVPLFQVYRGLVKEVTCVDWPQSLHKSEHIDVFADLTLPLPLPDASFDTVVLTDVLEHIPTPDGLITEIARVLRPGGRVMIGVPFMYWLHEGPYDFNRYTRYQLARLLEKAGLNVLQLTEIGGSPEVVVDVVGKTLPPRLAAWFVRIAQWLLTLRLLKKISERTRSAFPLEYLVIAEKPAGTEQPT
jgi:SAM-dependent methyltransferase